MSKLRILIIEDQENWRNQLSKLVLRLGAVDFDIAIDYEAAENYIETKQYDLAVVDLLLATGMAQVPENAIIDLKLLRVLRESSFNRSCGVVVLSGYGNTARVRQALLEYGAFDFIEKDQFSTEHFLDTLGMALLDTRHKIAVERSTNRYRFEVQLGSNKLLGCELVGPDRRSSYSAANPALIEISDLSRRADNLNLFILNGGANVWRPEARSIGNAAYAMLAQDQRVLGDLRAAQALARQSDDLWLEFSGPADSLGAPFELPRDEDYLTFAHMMTRRLVLPTSGLLHKVRSFHLIVGKMLKEKSKVKVLIIGSNSDGRIPAADREAEAVADLIESELKHFRTNAEITLLQGSAAAYANVCDALSSGGYHIFHYAGHGRFDDSLPEINGLILRDGNKLRAITASTLNMLVRNSPLELVYLSCCFGARSEGQAGRGDFSGMLEAFARADVPVVLGYRWTVADAPAGVMAESFHGSLWRNLSPAESLLRARRASAMSEEGRDDDSWASPVLLMQNA